MSGVKETRKESWEHRELGKEITPGEAMRENASRDLDPPALGGFDILLADVVEEGKTAYAFDLLVADIPGITKDILEVIYLYKGNLMKMHGFRMPDNNRARLFIIATHDDYIDVNEMCSALRAVEGVMECKIYGPYDGPTLMAPPPVGLLLLPYRAGDGRVLLIRVSTLQYIFDTIYWTLPASSRSLGLQILYTIGRFVGGFMRSLTSTVTRHSGREFVESVLTALRSEGWLVDYRVEERRPGDVVVEMLGYWLRPITTRNGSYLDPFTAGLLEDVLEDAWGGTWDVTLEDYKPGEEREGNANALHVYHAVKVED